MQTADFGEIAVQLSASAMAVGKQEVLNALMAECPQLKLKKERLGWDPHAIARANKVQQDVLKSKHEFKLLKEIKNRISEQEAPLTLDQLRGITTNYDADLDDVLNIPESYLCEDDGVPVLCLESTASTQPPTTNNPAIETEQAGF